MMNFIPHLLYSHLESQLHLNYLPYLSTILVNKVSFNNESNVANDCSPTFLESTYSVSSLQQGSIFWLPTTSFNLLPTHACIISVRRVALLQPVPTTKNKPAIATNLKCTCKTLLVATQKHWLPQRTNVFLYSVFNIKMFRFGFGKV